MDESIDFHGLPAVRWGAGGATAIATRQGAHLVSWIPAGGREALFLSERSAFVAGTAIRGGVPVCFPQFADRGPLAQHGFARAMEWQHAATQAGTATFVLRETAATRALWPHAFRLELAITVGGTGLASALRVTNTGGEPWSFTTALHSYFAVDAARATLHGLRGVAFLTRGEAGRHAEPREAIPASEPVDRTYFAAPRTLRLVDAARAFEISQEGFTDTVVWNPGTARAAQMADMAPGAALRMLCVEAAAVEPAVVLSPGAAWQGRQVVEVSP